MGSVLNNNILFTQPILGATELINHTSRFISIPITNVCLTKDITEIYPSNSWSGKRCLILGGGPSLQGFDYSLIRNDLTIGINKTFMIFGATVNYCMDYTFFEVVTNGASNTLMANKWKEYVGTRVFLKHNNKTRFADNVYTVNKIEREIVSTDLKAGIHGSNNSGLGAILLAIALGARNIGLLGFDMKTYNNKTHWHIGYRKSQVPVEEYVARINRVLNDFRDRFEIMAPMIQQAGARVVNLNPDSALKCFEFGRIEEFLKKDGG